MNAALANDESPGTRVTYLDSSEKLKCHMERVLHLQEFGFSYPAHMTLGLVTYCDQFCKGCYAGGYRFNPEIVFTSSFDVLSNALRSASQFGKEYEAQGHPHYSRATLGLKSVTLVGSGEPFLYPHLTRLVPFMRNDLGLDIGAYTNGNTLRDGVVRSGIDTAPQNLATLVLENFRFIRISLDAASERVHSLERGVRDQFRSILANIADLVKRRAQMKKKEPTIGLQFTVDDNNVKEIVAIARLAKDLGVDYLAYKPKYVPWNVRKDRWTAMGFQDVEGPIGEAQSLADESFAVHGKFPQFKLAWGPDRKNNCESYSKCTDVWLSSYLDVDVKNSPQRDAANMRVFLCVNKDKEEAYEGGRPKWSIGPIEPSTDFGEFWKISMPELVGRIEVRDCVAGCKNDPYNQAIAQLLPRPKEELIRIRRDPQSLAGDVHVNHI